VTRVRKWLADELLRLALSADRDHVLTVLPQWYDLDALAVEREREATRKTAPAGAVISADGRSWVWSGTATPPI
jgi:hypothetical protein